MNFEDWWGTTKPWATPETFAGWEHSCRQAWRTAQLVERERCAKLCESTYPEWNPEDATFQKPCFDTLAECAAAIREDQP